MTLTYSSWVPGAAKIVALWNKQNPDIQVKYTEVPQGPAGTYQNDRNEIKAGTAGDLGFIEYEVLPSFRVGGGLANIANCPGVQAAAAKYVPWAWNQGTFGQPDSVYGIPHDVGPMALYYRKDLFAKYGLTPPTTWAQFYQDAKVVHSHGGAYLTNVSAYGSAWIAGLVWQAGGSWFQNNGTSWKVTIDSPTSLKVADYWQQFISQNLASGYNFLSDQWFHAINTNQLWSVIGAAWTAKLIQVNSPQTTGKWAVAELPQWTAGDNVNGNWGGSSLVVYKDSKYPADAVKFAEFLTSDVAAQNLNVINGGVYPSTVDAASTVAALKLPAPLTGSQPIWSVFGNVSKQVNPTWVWGPTETQTDQDLQDQIGQALAKKITMAQAFQNTQASTVTAMQATGITVQK